MTVLAALVLAPYGDAKDLVVNGSFDDEQDRLQGWNYDYRWTGNENYAENYTRVSVVDEEARQKDVLRIAATPVLETKVESTPIPFDPDADYRCTLRMKGGRARIYLCAYKWKPGVRPHDSPTLGELRPIYRSKTFDGSSRSWKTIDLELSMDNASKTGQNYLSQVRFFTVYIWSLGELFIDDVEVQKSR